MQKLEFDYKDKTEAKRFTVLPHLLGKLKSTANIVLSGWDETDIKAGWKTFLVSKISDVELADEGFEQTAVGYNPKDKRMATIICSIPSVR